MRLTRLHQVGGHVEDLEQTRAFYCDVLGARHLATFNPPGLLFFEFAGVRLLLEKSARPTTLYFWVDDIDAAFAELKSKGVTFEDEPHLIHKDETGIFDTPGSEEWMTFFRDPGDNVLALATRRLT